METPKIKFGTLGETGTGSEVKKEPNTHYDNPETVLGPSKDNPPRMTYEPDMPMSPPPLLGICKMVSVGAGYADKPATVVGNIDTTHKTLSIEGDLYYYSKREPKSGPPEEVDFDHLDIALRCLRIEIDRGLLGKILRVFSLLTRQPDVTLRDLVKLK